MKKELGFEGLEKDSYEEFEELTNEMNLYVELMYKILDGKKERDAIFLDEYRFWKKDRLLILQNKFNDCGHKLSIELENEYTRIITERASELFFTF